MLLAPRETGVGVFGRVFSWSFMDRSRHERLETFVVQRKCSAGLPTLGDSSIDQGDLISVSLFSSWWLSVYSSKLGKLKYRPETGFQVSAVLARATVIETYMAVEDHHTHPAG